MIKQLGVPIVWLMLVCWPATAGEIEVDSVEALIEASAHAQRGDTIKLAKGTYELPRSLRLQAGVALIGASTDHTILTNAEAWRVGRTGLPDKEVDHRTVRRDAYLIDLGDKAEDVTIAGLTLKGNGLHGAIYGNVSHRLTLRHLKIEDFLWSGVRLFRLHGGTIHGCLFIDAGGRAKGDKGITGGCIFFTWVRDCEIYNKRFQ